MESGLNAVARDWLKLGRLVLHDGFWEGGERILPAPLLREATAPAIPPDPPTFTAGNSNFARHRGLFYGLLWWGFAAPGSPPDAFALGLYGQVLYIARRCDAVLLRTGWEVGGVDYWPALLRDLASALSEVEPDGQARK
jgi:CubicO group peptidase (beta-lactamase class C family)